MSEILYSTNSKGVPVFTFSDTNNKYTVTFNNNGTVDTVKKGTKNVTEVGDDFVVAINENDIPYYEDLVFTSMSFIDKDGHPGTLTFNVEHQLVTFRDEARNITIHYLAKHGDARYNALVLRQINNVITYYPVGMVFAVNEEGVGYTLEVIGGKVHSITENS